MSDHAVYSPSAAHRWVRCPASIQMEARIPNKETSYAKEGTDAHELAAECLSQGSTADRYIGDVLPNGTQVTDDFAEYVDQYVEGVRASLTPASALGIERVVDFSLSLGEPNSFGTVDAFIIHPETQRLELHDLKFGQGVRVDAKENEQLCLYALGLLEEVELLFNVQDVKFCIHQPRLDHLSIWDTNVKWLKMMAKKFNKAVKASKQTTPEFHPGEKQCRFCNAFATCKAAQEKVHDVLQGEFECL